jgi:hypothetical protein
MSVLRTVKVQKEVKTMEKTALLLLEGDSNKVNEIVSYIDTYEVETSDIIDFIHAAIFSEVED